MSENNQSIRQIVTVGGGTGTFVVLSALKELPSVSLTAIVSSADDGGSTGHLRDAYGFLPAGDARLALVALAKDGQILRDLFAYRFEKGNVAGHNLGNLFLTALTDLKGSDAEGLLEASKILRIKGQVISASEQASTLVAELTDGSIIEGEHEIDTRAKRAGIASVSLKDSARLTDEARTALEEADVIILGPGDLFTSTAAALLAEGTKETIAQGKAMLVYVANLFTKAGQTDGYTARQHVQEIERYSGRAPDRILIHDGSFTDTSLAWYASEEEFPVVDDLGSDARVRRVSLASVDEIVPHPHDSVPRSLIRHDPERLRAALTALLNELV